METVKDESFIIIREKAKLSFPDIIKVKSVDEVPYYMMLLGDEYSVYSSKSTSINSAANEIMWPDEPNRLLVKVFGDIPTIHKGIRDLEISFDVEKLPEKIKQELVHKENKDNVIVSKEQRFGNIWHFNVFTETKEFNFDHESDHIQGMLAIEASRQIGIATVHLNGLDIDGKLVLGGMDTQFLSYLDYGSPIIARSISNPLIFSEKDGSPANYYIIVDLIQYGKVCSTTIFKGITFKSAEGLKKYRERAKKINERVKLKYNNLLKETG